MVGAVTGPVVGVVAGPAAGAGFFLVCAIDSGSCLGCCIVADSISSSIRHMEVTIMFDGSLALETSMTMGFGLFAVTGFGSVNSRLWFSRAHWVEVN